MEQISTEVPGSFGLAQKYPNPFNPTTKIKFLFPSFHKEGCRKATGWSLWRFTISSAGRLQPLLTKKYLPAHMKLSGMQAITQAECIFIGLLQEISFKQRKWYSWNNGIRFSACYPPKSGLQQSRQEWRSAPFINYFLNYFNILFYLAWHGKR